MSYNGWCNWETWNVALWCDNDEGIYRERMRQKPADPAEVEDFVRDIFPNGTPDMTGENDDPYASREAVDWQEIAEHWRADYDDITDRSADLTDEPSFDTANPLSDEEAREERI